MKDNSFHHCCPNEHLKDNNEAYKQICVHKFDNIGELTTSWEVISMTIYIENMKESI